MTALSQSLSRLVKEKTMHALDRLLMAQEYKKDRVRLEAGNNSLPYITVVGSEKALIQEMTEKLQTFGFITTDSVSDNQYPAKYSFIIQCDKELVSAAVWKLEQYVDKTLGVMEKDNQHAVDTFHTALQTFRRELQDCKLDTHTATALIEEMRQFTDEQANQWGIHTQTERLENRRNFEQSIRTGKQ